MDRAVDLVSCVSNFSLVKGQAEFDFLHSDAYKMPIKYSPLICFNFYSLNYMVSKNKILYFKNWTEATKIQVGAQRIKAEAKERKSSQILLR